MRVFMLLAVAAITLLVPSTAVAGEARLEMVVEPGRGASTAPGGGWFQITAAPGEAVSQPLGVRNAGASAIQVALAPVDARTGPLGGVDYALATDEPARVAQWLTVERTAMTLAPGESAIVPFTVTVPAGARSGVHLAGIAVWQADGAISSPAATDAMASIDVRTRRVVAVEVQVPGDAAPRLEITGVRPAVRPDGMYLEIQLENQGRGLATAQGRISLPGDSEPKVFSVDTFVPETTVDYPVKWQPRVDPGRYPVRVDLTYDGGQTTGWDGFVVVDADVDAQLADRLVTDAPARTSPWWHTPAAAVAVVSALVLALYHSVRRRRVLHAPRAVRPIPPPSAESTRRSVAGATTAKGRLGAGSGTAYGTRAWSGRL